MFNFPSFALGLLLGLSASGTLADHDINEILREHPDLEFIGQEEVQVPRNDHVHAQMAGVLVREPASQDIVNEQRIAFSREAILPVAMHFEAKMRCRDGEYPTGQRSYIDKMFGYIDLEIRPPDGKLYQFTAAVGEFEYVFYHDWRTYPVALTVTFSNGVKMKNGTFNADLYLEKTNGDLTPIFTYSQSMPAVYFGGTEERRYTSEIWLTGSDMLLAKSLVANFYLSSIGGNTKANPVTDCFP